MPGALTSNGLQIPTIEEILQELSDDQRATIDALLDTAPDAPIGQLNGILAERERVVWEALQVAYGAFNPDDTEDFLLDALCAITGTKRGAATYSKVFLNLNIDASKTIPAGSQVSQDGNSDVVFALDADVTSTTAGVYEHIAATCTTLGRVIANAGTLTVIQTPVNGWNSVTNVRDAIPGTERDTDPELRVRRENELEAIGAGNVDAIRAEILQIQNDDESKPVIDCIVVENTTDYISATGQPAHSVEAIIWDSADEDADNDDVAQVLWDKKAGGIEAFGAQLGTAHDSLDQPQVMHFTRASIDNLKMRITLTIPESNPEAYAGDDAFKLAVTTEFALRARLGVREIRCSHYVKAGNTVGGVVDVNSVEIQNVLIGSYPAPGENYSVPVRTKAELDSSDIELVILEEDP